MTHTAVQPAIVDDPAPAGVEGPRKKPALRLPEDRLRFAAVVLFAAGAILMPLGLFAVGFGWYGAARARYAYDQFPYLLSGGLTGVCLTTIGGFLYFGAWIAKGQAEQRDAASRLDQHLQALPDRLALQLAVLLADGGAAGADAGSDLGAVPVVAGAAGSMVHRRDCRLIAGRDDLRPATPADSALTPCRVCKPAPL